MTKYPTVKLRGGVEMPQLGFGVFQIPDLKQAEQSVLDALEIGYRLIDTAAAYRNEAAVGKAIKKSGIPRKEIFVTTKLWIQDVDYEHAKSGFELSLKNLDLEYIDLLLLHQPYNDVYGAWRAMEELLAAGKVHAIGVSNFNSDRLVDLAIHNDIVPMVNQIEIHPFNQQTEALDVMREYNVQPEGWAPFAEGRKDLFTNDTLVKIGEDYGKSAGQVVLRWNMQRGVVAIPKSTHKERIAENFDIFDFELSSDDMKAIAELDEKTGLFVEHENPETIKNMSGWVVHD